MKLPYVVIAVILALLLINCLFAGNCTVQGQTFQTITILENGCIDPPDAPISKAGTTYTLTGDIYGGIIVRCFNVVLDGAGYTLQGNGTDRGIEVANAYNSTLVNSYNVTVQNFKLRGHDIAIGVFAYWGNILEGVKITANNISGSNVGIRLASYARYANNTISSNTIEGNTNGLRFEMAMEDNYSTVSGVNTVKENRFLDNQVGISYGWQYSYYQTSNLTLLMPNQIYYNDFIGNTQDVENWKMLFSPTANTTWENPNTHLGNYWSRYQGVDSNNDGVR